MSRRPEEGVEQLSILRVEFREQMWHLGNLWGNPASTPRRRPKSATGLNALLDHATDAPEQAQATAAGDRQQRLIGRYTRPGMQRLSTHPTGVDC